MPDVKSKLSGVLQENVLTLLCFDDEAAGIVTRVVDVGLFESSIYRRIAESAARYYKRYERAAGDHLPDLFEELLAHSDKPERRVLERTLKNLRKHRDSVNRKFVLDELERFVDQQTMRRTVTEAADLLRSGDLEKAKRVMADGAKTRSHVFQAGDTVRTLAKRASFFDVTEEVAPLGIEPMDRMYMGPAAGELFTFLAPTNRGKSWFLQHVARACLLQRLKVLDISLEMSAIKKGRRYVQSVLSMTKRQMSEVRTQILQTDDRGLLTRIDADTLTDRRSLADSDAHNFVNKRLQRLRMLDNLIIKQFPTGQLTIDAMYAYMDMLEQYEGFVPDVLLVDYADLMKIDTANLRLDTGRVYKELRGVAVERNIRVFTASQTNRGGEDSKVLTVKYMGEDYSKAQTSDTVVSYNQTKNEKAMGVARLFVAKARDEASSQTVVISQAYAIGQFCLGAALLPHDYWSMVDDDDGEGSQSKPGAAHRLPRRRKGKRDDS
jgi:replicative DNA helicase